MKETTILFPSTQEALSVLQILEKEFEQLAWDGCNGLDVNIQEYREEEYDEEDIWETFTFQTAIGGKTSEDTVGECATGNLTQGITNN